MSKRVAVLFSSGLDSTYLVWKNLTEGNEVLPIYIEIENNETKTILEKNRIGLLWKAFKKEFDEEPMAVSYRKPLLRSILYAIKVSVHANEDSLYFKQVPIWLFSVVFLQSLDVDEIQIGYVSNDDAISYLEDIQNIYKAYQAICEPMIPLVFPLTKTKKYKMAHELPFKYRDLIFSCEGAKIIGSKDAEVIKYEACCECGACRGIVASNYYEFDDFPEPYVKNLEYHHIRALRRKGFTILDKEGKEYFSSNEMLEKSHEPYQLCIDWYSSEMEYIEKKAQEDKVELKVQG